VSLEPRRPDWYADPLGRHALRFWDGEQWTERVSDGGRLATDAVDLELAGWMEEHGGDKRARWPGWVAPSAVVVAVASSLIAGVGARAVDALDVGRLAAFATGATILYGLLLAFSWHVRRRLGTEHGMRFDYGLHFKANDIGWGFLLSIAGRLGAAIVLVPIALIDEDYVSPDRSAFEGVGDGVTALVAITVVAVVMAPIFEELFFRGVLQRSLDSVLPAWAAIAVASVLFGLAHVSLDLGPANVGVVLAITVAGAVLGITAHVTKRLGRAIWTHAIFNIVPVALAWSTA
jgi:membrane protease YdiL (CAAX protease family)